MGIQGSLLFQGQGIQVGREGTHQVEQDKPQAGQGSLGGRRKSPILKKCHLAAVQGSLVELGIQVEGSLAGGSPVQGSHLHLKVYLCHDRSD